MVLFQKGVGLQLTQTHYTNSLAFCLNKPRMSQEEAEKPRFPGFVIPRQNWFRMPNNWTDITSRMASLAELKVVEYVLRHTWGYHEYGLSKRISTNEFMHGRRRQDGSRIDQGTGLSNRSVIDGLRNAVEHGYLIEERNDRDKARVKKHYQLHMKNLQPDVKNLHRGVQNLHSSGEESSHRSEKDTPERHFTVNGDHTTHSPLRQLRDLDQSKHQTDMIAEEILSELGDKHSARFYQLVAAKVPYDVIHQAFGEIKVDGAEAPPKVFTDRMHRHAMRRLTSADQ